jgi:hypothetical protein
MAAGASAQPDLPVPEFPGDGRMFMYGHQILLTFPQRFQHCVERYVIARAKPIPRNLPMGRRKLRCGQRLNEMCTSTSGLFEVAVRVNVDAPW